jgi:hypothetical protein
MSLLELQADCFTGLFGSGRGVVGSQREEYLRASAPATFLEQLLGVNSLPVGLSLLVGAPASGKSVVAAYLASQLPASGLVVAYLDCENSNIASLIVAQPAEDGENGSIIFARPERARAANEAQDAITQGIAKVVILDSLTSAAPATAISYTLTAAAVAKKHGASALYLCTSAASPAWAERRKQLELHAELTLETRRSKHANTFTVRDHGSGREASLRLNSRNSRIIHVT